MAQPTEYLPPAPMPGWRGKIYGFPSVPHDHKLRLRWLEYQAALCDPPFIAVIGMAPPLVVLALAHGLRRAPNLTDKFPRRLWLFHRKDKWFKAARVLRGAFKKNQGARRGLRVCPPSDPSRRGWKQTAEDLAGAGTIAFSAIYHLGQGQVKGILADFEALAAMTDDRTMLVICHIKRRGPRAAFEHFRRNLGWNGVEPVAGVGLLRRAPYPKPIRTS